MGNSLLTQRTTSCGCIEKANRLNQGKREIKRAAIKRKKRIETVINGRMLLADVPKKGQATSWVHMCIHCGNIRCSQISAISKKNACWCRYYRALVGKNLNGQTVVDVAGPKPSLAEANYRYRSVEITVKCNNCQHIKTVTRASILLMLKNKKNHCKQCKWHLFKHGKTNTRIHRIWTGMKQRITNPNNPSYRNYGGRGIDIDSRWMKFENFYKDMGDPPEGCSLDRLDYNKGYSKSNCVWADKLQQALNRRVTKTIALPSRSHITIDGKNAHDIMEESEIERIIISKT